MRLLRALPALVTTLVPISTWAQNCTTANVQNNATRTGSASGKFSVSNGRIIAPNGTPWRGHGIGVYDDDVTSGGALLARQMLSTLPQLNLVRVANYALADPANYAAFVSAMSAAHVLVVFEDHNTKHAVLSGSGLAKESAWYASMASYYQANSYVAFQTMNEPGANDSAQMQATYNAIRETGSDALIFMEAGSGADGTPSTLGDTSVFASMHNVAWDMHTYNWQSNYSSSVSAIQADQNNRIINLQAINSADGVMPVISLESGNSSEGTTIDPGAAQESQATFTNQNLAGVAVWIWNNPGTARTGANTLTANGSSLTSYGRLTAEYIASSQPSTCVATPSPSVSTRSGSFAGSQPAPGNHTSRPDR